MTDTNPLAALTLLLDDMDRLGDHPANLSQRLLTTTVRLLAERLRAALAEARQAVDALVAERDAYRRAKQENDERFMLERDGARAERDAAREALARVEALAKVQAVTSRARAESDRDALDVLAIIERAALAQPATDEEAE